MIVFIERLDEVGSLSCFVRIFVYIEHLGLELIFSFIPSILVYPILLSDFPRNIIDDHNGD
jgi:hypothetical protein